MELFKLFGTIAVNNSDANNAIDESSDKAESFGSKLKNGIGTAAKWGTAIVGGASAAGAALIKFAESSASTADNIDKMSQKIGISRQAYQELDFICSQSGTSVDNLQMGMKSLVTAMDGAASGTASNVEQFEKLGISVVNADGSLRSSEEVMWETMSALQAMDNQTEKARLATELFGRSGTELMPLLNGATGSIDEMKQQAHDLGLVLGDELIDNGANLTNSLDQTKRAFQSIITQLGAALMPILTNVSEYIQKAMLSIQSLVSKLTPVITTLFEKLLPPLMDLAESIFPVVINLLETLIPPCTDIITAILPVITKLLNMLLPPILKIVRLVLPLLISLIEPLLPLLEPIFNLLQPLIDILMVLLEPLIQLLNMILPPLIQVISTIISIAIVPLQNAFEVLASIISTVVSTAFNNIKIYVDTIKNVFKGIIDFIKNVFTGNWKGAWESVKNIFTSIFNGLKNIVGNIFNGILSVIKAPVNGVIKMLNKMIEALNKLSFDVPDWIPVIGGKKFGFNLKPISLLAEGGIVKRPTPSIIGEDGQEAVIPLERNTEWIHNVARQIHNFVVESKNTPQDVVSDIALGGFVTTLKAEVGKRINNLELLVAEIVEMLKEMFPQLLEAFDVQMVLNDGTLVAKLTPKIDRELGMILQRKKRGMD